MAPNHWRRTPTVVSRTPPCHGPIGTRRRSRRRIGSKFLYWFKAGPARRSWPPSPTDPGSDRPRGCHGRRRSAVRQVVSGARLVPGGSKLWGKDSRRLAEQVVACDRPTAGSQARVGQGADPSFLSSRSPRRWPTSRRPTDRTRAERPAHGRAVPCAGTPTSSCANSPPRGRDGQDANSSATSRADETVGQRKRQPASTTG